MQPDRIESDRRWGEQRHLPWLQVGKHSLFDGPRGGETLAQLFGGSSRLVVYRFLFGAEEHSACGSFLDSAVAHLERCDVALVAVSPAPMARIAAFKRRMGWKFHWLSSVENPFDELRHRDAPPGVTAFYKDEWGDVFQTYTCHGRGLAPLVGAYTFLDLAPQGAACVLAANQSTQLIA